MRPLAWCSVPTLNERVALGHGDLIGRIDSAALHVDDARISEAHAMVSLRGEALRLLALRGRIRVDGRFVNDVEIVPGLRVLLADAVELHFERVHLPAEVLAIRFADLPQHVLTSTISLHSRGGPTIVPGFDPRASAVLWSTNGVWRMVEPDGTPRPLHANTSCAVGGVPLVVEAVSLESAAYEGIRPLPSTGLELLAAGAAVRIQRPGDERPTMIGGVPGRILDQLIRAGGALSWRGLADGVWPDDRSVEASLRRRLDAGIGRLRERLREADAEHIEIALDGAGTVCLRLTEQDRTTVQASR